MSKTCGDCGEEISEKRLAAQPHARLCVPCLEKRGDVRRIRKYEDYDTEGNEVAQVFFLDDKSLERNLRRRNTAKPVQDGDVILSDDSNVALASAHSLAEEFEAEDSFDGRVAA
jgi:hypothetical protein